MNNVNVIGRSARDAELRYTPSGIAVCELNIAVDDGWGENKSTVWLGIVCWQKTAELAASIRKGDRIGISGRLTQDEWDDKETGKKQRKTKVTCERLTFIENKRDQGDTQEAPPRQRQQATPPAQDDNHDEDDISF